MKLENVCCIVVADFGLLRKGLSKALRFWGLEARHLYLLLNWPDTGLARLWDAASFHL